MERGSHVREALRTGTAETHQALDALWDGKSLAERGHYLRFLAASAAALLPIEAGLAASRVDILVPDWPLRRRSDAITADLAGFGVAVPAADPVAFGSPKAMLGTLYVLEGSRLGGRCCCARPRRATTRRSAPMIAIFGTARAAAFGAVSSSVWTKRTRRS